MVVTNSETRVFGKFFDVLHLEIALQMAEIFKLTQKVVILTCVFSPLFKLWTPISPEIMIAETCGAHCSKAESSENVSEHSKGDLKREPKISKNPGCGF